MQSKRQCDRHIRSWLWKPYCIHSQFAAYSRSSLPSCMHTQFSCPLTMLEKCDPTPELQLIPRRSTQGSGSHAAPSKCTRKGNKNCHMMNEESFTDLAQRKRKRIKNEPIVCVCIAYQEGLMQKGQIELCLQTMECISCCLHDNKKINPFHFSRTSVPKLCNELKI